jgi:polysaccharide biosynthesis protein PslG
MRTRAGQSKILLSGVALLLGCAVGVSVLAHSKSGSAAVQRPASHQVAQRRTPPHHVLIGIADPELINQTAKVQAAQLARMRSIGINSIRLDANWDWVQFAGADSFDWTMLDREIDSVHAAGLTVDLVIDGCPPWAALAGTKNDSSPQPASAVQFAAWAADVAQRYTPDGVKDFEIWNEPNDTKFWQPKANPVFYTRMLSDSYRAIKKIDPSAVVVAGGLAPVTSRGGSLSMIAFLRAIYAHGARPYLNAVAVHPYSFPALPSTYEPWSAWSQMNQTSPSVRSVMKQYKDANESIWITEFGAPSNGPSGVGANGEAAELKQAITIAKSTSWIGAIFIYTWQDAGANKRTDADWFGLLTNRGQVKAAYKAVVAAIGKKKG